jgi:hypothetical protein
MAVFVSLGDVPAFSSSLHAASRAKEQAPCPGYLVYHLDVNASARLPSHTVPVGLTLTVALITSQYGSSCALFRKVDFYSPQGEDRP